jgi:Tfp pilus assembly protein PilX
MKLATPLKSQSGMILFTSLAILSVLLMVGIGSRVMLQNDYRVLTNLRGSTEAFYLAVAGLEWGKNEVARSMVFPPAPTDRTENFAAGSFSTLFLTPRAIGPLSAGIVVRSTGTIGTATQQVQAQLTKTYDLSDAAVGLRGNASSVNLNGSAVAISGLDYDPISGAPVPSAKPRPAISAGDALIYQMVDQAVGLLPSGSVTSVNGSAAISTSANLSSSSVSQLADQLCGLPGVIIDAVPVGGALVYQNQAWGSRAAPQVRCIDGTSAVNDTVTLSAVNGAGILVIRNSDLVLTGQFHWEGLIVLTGSSVALAVSSASAKEVIGSVLINETGAPDSSKALLDIQGNIQVKFSRRALTAAAGLIPTANLSNTLVSLPFFVKQDYWRNISP